MMSQGGGVEPRWSREGKEIFYFSGQKLMAADVTLNPSFSSGSPKPLFEAPIVAGYTNDGHEWQVSPHAKRFLTLTAPGENNSAPVTVMVNWTADINR